MMLKQKLNDYLSGDLGQILQTFRKELIAIAGFSMVVNILMLAPTLYMLQIFDRIFISRSNLTLYVLSAITLLFFVVVAISETLRSRLLVRAGVRFDMAVNARLFQAAFHERLKGGLSNPGDMFANLTQLRQFLTGNGVFAFFDAPWTPIYVIACFFLHPVLGVSALIFTAILVYFAWYNQRWTKKSNERALEEVSNENAFLQSKLRNAEVIESMGMLGHLLHRWKSKHMTATLAIEKSQDEAHKIGALIKFVQYSLQSLTLAVGALLVIEGELTAGAMIAANFLVARALQPIQMIVATWRQSFQAKQAFESLEKLLAENPAYTKRLIRTPEVGVIEVHDLVATAPKRAEPILKGINASFKPGDVMVIVGPSGSGKSTFARCLLGIWPFVTGGQVNLDGEDVRVWDKNLLGPHIGYLPQDIELLDGTIAENIARFGEVDSEKVIEAATSVGIHDTILRMPQGYDTPIGEAGRRLSGGQRQRLGLARALYGKPMMMVLDEPNANLDDVGEMALYKVVAEMRAQGKTIFLISHRPAAMQVADVIVVMNNGHIQAMGPKEQILNTNAPNNIS